MLSDKTPSGAFATFLLGLACSIRSLLMKIVTSSASVPAVLKGSSENFSSHVIAVLYFYREVFCVSMCLVDSVVYGCFSFVVRCFCAIVLV